MIRTKAEIGELLDEANTVVSQILKDAHAVTEEEVIRQMCENPAVAETMDRLGDKIGQIMDGRFGSMTDEEFARWDAHNNEY